MESAARGGCLFAPDGGAGPKRVQYFPEPGRHSFSICLLSAKSVLVKAPMNEFPGEGEKNLCDNFTNALHLIKGIVSAPVFTF